MARTWANQTSDRIAWSGGPLLYNNTAASIMCWFKRGASSASGAYHRLFTQQAAYNIEIALQIIAGGANDGKLECNWRTPAGSAYFISTTAWDDGAWHRLLYVRRNASPYAQLYIDGVSDGSDTGDPTTDATAVVDQYWGNDDTELGSFGGTLARCAFIAGVALTPTEADSFLYTGKIGRKLDQWLEMVGGSPEPDWSGNALNGTLTATTIADHAPAGPPFSAVGGWRGAFTAAAQAAAPALYRLPRYGRLLGVGR